MTSRVLVACEESGVLTAILRRYGVEAYSCDLLPTSGDLPQYHLQQDVLPLLKEEWLAVFAFPPCDHLAVSGAKWFDLKRRDGRQQQGIDFFMQFADLPHVEYVEIENPVGIMSTIWRRPDQIVQPFFFGDSFRKTTCLWQKNLPLLKPTNMVEAGVIQRLKSGKSLPEWYSNAKKADRKRIRGRTFDGMANAMVLQRLHLLKRQ